MRSTARSTPAPRRTLGRHGRLAAAGVVGGGGFLLGRTVVLMAGGSLTTLVWWAAGLLLIEFVIDAAVVATGMRWLLSGKAGHAVTALRAVATMIVVHAVRVAVFVLGRTGPWVDFEVRPAHRADHAKTWTWTGVWIAAVGAGLGVIALLIAWRRRMKSAQRQLSSR